MKLETIYCSKLSHKEGQPVCSLGYYGGNPSPHTCRFLCPNWSLENDGPGAQKYVEIRPKKKWFKMFKEHRGLGDTVKWAIKVVSFGLIKQKKDCGCKNRQNWLNRKFPYPWSDRGE